MSDLKIKVKKLNPEAKLPTKAHPTDAGWDLYYCSQDPKFNEVRIYSGRRFLFGTGVALELPEGYYGQIVPRSGLAWKNGADTMAGVVDNSYRGEVKVILNNEDKDSYVRIRHGDRVAQLVILPSPKTELIEVEELNPSDRDTAGFGSTGK